MLGPGARVAPSNDYAGIFAAAKKRTSNFQVRHTHCVEMLK